MSTSFSDWTIRVQSIAEKDEKGGGGEARAAALGALVALAEATLRECGAA